MTVILLAGYNKGKVYAATDAAFESSIAAFPNSYKPYLRTLHEKYPKWKFVAYDTGLKFTTVVNQEFSGNKSLIENSFSKLLKSNASSDYNKTTGSYIAKDGGSWVSASKNCVAYFVDPRNFLNETHIYMFENLSFDAATQTQAGVEAILKGSFMYQTNIGYITTEGKYKSTDILYSTQIMEAAKTYNVSAYYIASKIVQEIGTGANSKYAGMGASGSVSGIYSSQYTGIYNFYNIGATSSGTPIANGLSWASGGGSYSRPWDTPMKSINGGAEYIGEKYINCGQNTIYYQRFNVNNASTYALYTHQYMTNIYGAANEAAFTQSAYEDLGITALEKTFVIPVYTDMPVDGNTISYGDTTTKGTITSTVNVRNQASTSGTIVTTLNAGDEVTISNAVMTNVDFSSRWLSNPYWYKINVKKNGTTYNGYVAATYINVNQEYSVVKGESITVPVSLGTSEKVYYRSDNPAIASVGSAGKITGKAAGTVTIYAFTPAGDFAATAVQVSASGCILNINTLTLNVGDTKKLTATVFSTPDADQTVIFTSSDKTVAKVSKKGKITAVSAGEVTISAKSSNDLTATCAVKVLPAKVAMTGKSKNYQAVKLSWPATSNLTGYYLYRKDSSGKFVKIATLAGTATTYVDQGLTTGTKQNYKIAAYRTVNDVKYSSGKSSAVTVKPIPKKTQITSLAAISKGATLNWSKITKASGYVIYRKDGKNDTYKKVKTVKGNKTFTWSNTGLLAGKTYSYKIRVYKTVSGKKIYSEYSKVKKIKK